MSCIDCTNSSIGQRVENSKWTNGCEKSDIMMYMFHNLRILSEYYENNTEIKQGVAGN